MEVSQIPPVRKPCQGVIRLSLFLPKACLWEGVGCCRGSVVLIEWQRLGLSYELRTGFRGIS